MDTQTIIKAKYGISKRDLHTVPTWAKNERLERTVPLTEMWQMGDAVVKKWDKYSLSSLKAIFNGLFRQYIFQANRVKNGSFPLCRTQGTEHASD